MVITFRRYQTERFLAGVRVVDTADELARIYHSGGYVKFFLSLLANPEDEHDLDFPPHSVVPEILEFIGGRVSDKDVEECVARPLAKKTIVNRQFAAFRRRVQARCERGVVEPQTGTPYPNVYWERELPGLGLVLRRTLDDDPVVFRPMPESAKKRIDQK